MFSHKKYLTTLVFKLTEAMLFIIQFTCALFAGRDGRDCYPK